jgi:hypothetical protein
VGTAAIFLPAAGGAAIYRRTQGRRMARTLRECRRSGNPPTPRALKRRVMESPKGIFAALFFDFLSKISEKVCVCENFVVSLQPQSANQHKLTNL